MKNKEFYKDEIFEVACKRDRFALNKTTKEIDCCLEMNCCDCLFDSSHYCCGSRAMKWLEEEHVEPVLNDVEKRYLEAVLMPFKNRVLYVGKFIFSNSDKSYLEIRIKSLFGENNQESVLLPLFHYKKMYVGIEENRRYTIEELGLFK